MTTEINPVLHPAASGKAILCLCYDSNLLQVRRMLLEYFGYIVVPATSVESAKSAAQAARPDMLLMDNSHPGTDFEQVAIQIKTICPALIAVVLSPYYYGARDTSGGAIDRFVAKEEGPGVLIAQLEKLFGRHAADSRAASTGG